MKFQLTFALNFLVCTVIIFLASIQLCRRVLRLNDGFKFQGVCFLFNILVFIFNLSFWFCLKFKEEKSKKYTYY